MSAVARTAVVAAVLGLGACGGEKIGGSVEVPDGYETYKGEGVSFAYPKGMRRTEQRLPSGARLVRLVGAAAGGRPSAYVNFTVRPADAEVFEDVVRTTRSVFER